MNDSLMGVWTLLSGMRDGCVVGLEVTFRRGSWGEKAAGGGEGDEGDVA